MGHGSPNNWIDRDGETLRAHRMSSTSSAQKGRRLKMIHKLMISTLTYVGLILMSRRCRMKQLVIALLLGIATGALGYYGIRSWDGETGGHWFAAFGLTFILPVLLTGSFLVGGLIHAVVRIVVVRSIYGAIRAIRRLSERPATRRSAAASLTARGRNVPIPTFSSGSWTGLISHG